MSSTSEAGGRLAKTAPKTGVILIYHGSAEEEWSRAARLLTERVSRAAGAPVEVACVKDFPPSIEDAASRLAAAGVEKALVAPMFIAPGGHVARDFPALAERLKTGWPQIEFQWTEVTGCWDEVSAAVAAGVAGRLERMSRGG